MFQSSPAITSRYSLEMLVEAFPRAGKVFDEEYCDATENDHVSVFKREMKELLCIEKGLEEFLWDG